MSGSGVGDGFAFRSGSAGLVCGRNPRVEPAEEGFRKRGRWVRESELRFEDDMIQITLGWKRRRKFRRDNVSEKRFDFIPWGGY